MPARSNPKLNRGGIRQARHPVHRHDAAKPATPGIQRVVIAEHPLSYERARAVGPDDEVGFGRAAVVEVQRCACAGVIETDETLAQPNAIQPDGRGQDRLQIGAMNADIRRPEALAIGRPRLMLTDDAAAATVPVDKRRHLEPARSELQTEPELLKEASRVGRQRHRSADLAQLGGLLVDVDLKAVLAQRNRKGQPTNYAAAPKDWQFGILPPR